LNHLTNIPVGFTRKSSCIHIRSGKSHTENMMYFADGSCVRTWRNLYRYATGAAPQVHISPEWFSLSQPAMYERLHKCSQSVLNQGSFDSA